jgi:predicted secreted protein
LSVSLSAEGFSFESETENGYKELRSIWELGEPILCKYCTRGQDGTTYYSGQFIITSLSETSPAGQDATYNISLENSGAVTEYP